MRYIEYLETEYKLLKELSEGVDFYWYGRNREFLEINKYICRGFQFVEDYHGHDIYELDGKYIPYIGCNYYFTTLEDCKKRIDTKGIAIVPTSNLKGVSYAKMGSDIL